MPDATIRETELDGLDAVAAEVDAAIPMLEALQEALSQVRQWAARMPDRWAGTDWGTTALDQAVAGVPDAGQSLGSTEALAEQMTAVKKAVDQARTFAEVAAENGAYGRTEAFVR